MVKMTVRINRKKVEAANLEWLKVRSFIRGIKMLLERRGFTPIGNGTYENSSNDLPTLFKAVMLDFEEDDTTICYLKQWTAEADNRKYDLLKIYNERRKPFYEAVVKPQKEIDRQVRAAQIRSRILRGIGRIKNVDNDENEDIEPNMIEFNI